MLIDLVMIAESLPEGEGQLARALYKLSVLCGEMDRHADSERYKQRAFEVQAKLRPDQKDTLFDEDSFAKLCPWMLW